MIGDVSDNEDKILRRFSHWYQDGGSWTYADWNSWRQKDGMLCRMNSDCQWWEPGPMRIGTVGDKRMGC